MGWNQPPPVSRHHSSQVFWPTSPAATRAELHVSPLITLRGQRVRMKHASGKGCACMDGGVCWTSTWVMAIDGRVDERTAVERVVSGCQGGNERHSGPQTRPPHHAVGSLMVRHWQCATALPRPKEGRLGDTQPERTSPGDGRAPRPCISTAGEPQCNVGASTHHWPLLRPKRNSLVHAPAATMASAAAMSAGVSTASRAGLAGASTTKSVPGGAHVAAPPGQGDTWGHDDKIPNDGR